MITSRLVAAMLLAGAAGAQAQYTAYPQQGYEARDGYASSYRDGAQVESIEVFVEPLSRYGRWLSTRWGRAWQPAVDREWRPFTVGHWEETAAFGRTWRSDEPWGWATYHYGRWGFDDRYGWVWLPDTVWGPGWVAWREGGDYAGWAPLPPRVSLSFGVGAFASYGYDQWYAPSWVYVPRSYVYDRQVTTIILPPSRNRDWWERTRDVTHYEREGGRIVNRSFAPDRRGFDDRRVYDERQRGGEPRLGDPRFGERRDGARRDRDRREPGQRAADAARADPRLLDGRGTGVDDPRGDAYRRGDTGGADRRDYVPGQTWQRPSAGPARVQVQTAPGTLPPAGLNRPPEPNATRPYWEQRREQVFQPAAGGRSPLPPATAPRDEPQRFERGSRGDDRGGYARRGMPMPDEARPQLQAPPGYVARPQAQAPQVFAPPPAPRAAPPPPRAEQPRIEQPRVEQPRVEQPRPEQPRAERPRIMRDDGTRPQ